MRTKLLVIAPLFLLVLTTAVRLLVNEYSCGGGMGAAYESCGCSGVELKLADRSASDGAAR